MKDILCLWIRRLNSIEMILLPKAIYRCNIMFMKIPMTFSAEIEKKQISYEISRDPG